jgi:non-specific protein-tyrosine kinase
VSFGSGATSDVMTVSVTDGNRYMAARIANAYLRQYIQFRKHAAISQLNTVENLVASKLAAIPPDQRGGSVAQRLVADRNELDLRKSAQTGDAEVVETAAIPRSPSSPNPKKDGALGLLLGLLVGAALATLLDRRDRRIKTIEEVESIYGVPVIGSVPESSSLRLGGPGTPRDEEAFLMIRAQLRYFNVDRHIRRVMVTSANMGEGKSLISLNLARTAARTDDRRTLLIEADLRRPTLGTLMGRSGVAGLAELLSHAQELDTGLRDLVVTPDRMHDHPGRLDVLLAGATAPNPAELIESRRMEALLEAADSIYDTIIIDTPPIGLVSDAVPLVQKVDGLLVINRMGISRRDHAVHVVKRFRSLNARLLGVVVNSFRMPDKGDYGYYAQPGSNGMGKHGLLPHQPDARIR